SVVTNALASRPDKAYRFYKQNGFRYVQFIPKIDSAGDGAGDEGGSLDASEYGIFLCRLFDLWHADFVRGEYVSIRAFDNYIHMLAGRPPENCAMGGTCSAYALIEADGSVYPCDFYASDEHRLGSVADDAFRDMLRGDAARSFIAPSKVPHDDCARCGYFFICRGGCRRDREPVIDGRLALNKYCAAYKEFFSRSLPRMKEIAAMQR
ncbi:MAG: SPASM domain-containing protein, partial [Defluviitaleaceae bacterium]|nr:SPASM domain-containing protein [Defluviitaleaceae bacterium]